MKNKFITLFTALSLFSITTQANDLKGIERNVNLLQQIIISKPKIINPNSILKIWVPIPQNSYSQKRKSINIKINNKKFKNFSIEKEAKYNSETLYINIKLTQENLDKYNFPLKIRIISQVKRKIEHSHKDKLESPRLAINLFLMPNTKVPESQIIRDLTHQSLISVKLHKNNHNTIISNKKKIKKMYKYVVDSMSYDKSGTGWGKGDAIWACSTKRGNCTDFHSLLIAMSRSQKIPAKFLIGIPFQFTKKHNNKYIQIHGYHCWAKLLDQNNNWIPVDASESKKAHLPYKYYSYLPANRIMLSQGRDIKFKDQQGEPLNYFVFPYLEYNNKEYHNFTKTYSVRMNNTNHRN